MADIKKGSDLITTMQETATRVKKLERQLAVTRSAKSIVDTAESVGPISVSTSFAALPTADEITLVTTTNCVISFYFQFDMLSDCAATSVDEIEGTATVKLKDNETGYTSSLGAFTPGPVPQTAYQNSVVSSTGFLATQKVMFPLSDWASASGKHTFSLLYSFSPGFNINGTIPYSTTVTIKNRKLVGWVIPF